MVVEGEGEGACRRRGRLEREGYGGGGGRGGRVLLEPAHVHGCALLIPAGGFARRRERRQKKARERRIRATETSSFNLFCARSGS